jgi:hypothetical protein
MEDKRMASLPATLRFGPYDYDIERMPIGWRQEGTELLGQFDDNSNAIRLRHGHPSAQHALVTMLHEIIHGVYRVFGLGKRESEERVVDAMATALVQIMRDDPHLVAWMLEIIADADNGSS